MTDNEYNIFHMNECLEVKMKEFSSYLVNFFLYFLRLKIEIEINRILYKMNVKVSSIIYFYVKKSFRFIII